MSKKRKKNKGNPVNIAPNSRVMHQITEDGVTQYSSGHNSYQSFFEMFIHQWLSQVSNTLEGWFGAVATQYHLPAGTSRLVCEPAYASDLSDRGGLRVTIEGFDPEIWRRTLKLVQTEDRDALTVALTEVSFAVIGSALKAARVSDDVPASFAVGYTEDALQIEITDLPPLNLWLLPEGAAA